MKMTFDRLVAGLCLACLVGACGCASRRVLELDAQHPAVRMTTQGIKFDDEIVQPQEVAEILEDYDVPHDRVIHIQLDPDVKDLRSARFLMACLARAGYTRLVLVTKRHAESENLGKRKPEAVVPTPLPEARRRPVRYKKANE